MPINSSEYSGSKKDLQEEYSRELQVEEAFTIYQKAILSQRKGDYKSAYVEYEKLFKLDILSNHYHEEQAYIRNIQNGTNSNDELNYLSPNVRLLRFMALRNRGFLFFHILQRRSEIPEFIELQCSIEETDQSNIDKSKFEKEMFYTMLDDFIMSLVYQEGDEQLMNLMYEIFCVLHNRKLAKYTLEYLLSSNVESEDFFGLLQVNNIVKKKYDLLLEIINSTEGNLGNESMEQEIKQINKKLNFITDIVEDFHFQLENNKKLNSLTVEVETKPETLSWVIVIEGLNRYMKSHDSKKSQMSTKKLKYLDPYLHSDFPLERIKFDVVFEASSTDSKDDIISQREETFSKEHLSNSNESIPNEPRNQLDGVSGQDSIENDGERVATSDHGDEIVQEGDNDMYDNNNKSGGLLQETTSLNDAKSESSVANASKEEERISKSPSVIQRSSKRFRHKNEVRNPEIALHPLSRSSFAETESFFSKLYTYVQTFNHQTGALLELNNVVEYYIPKNDFSNENVDTPQYINQFVNLMNNWSNSNLTSLLVQDDSARAKGKSSEDEKMKLMEVLSAYENKDIQGQDEGLMPLMIDDYETPDKIKEFLYNSNKQCSHVQKIKVTILERLLTDNYWAGDLQKYCCLIIDLKWSTVLVDLVKEWILQMDGELLAEAKFDHMHNKRHLREILSFATSVYEILADYSITIKEQINHFRSTNARKHKTTVYLLSFELVSLNDKLLRWGQFIEELLCALEVIETLKDSQALKYFLRYKWATVHLVKSQGFFWQVGKSIMRLLQEILESIPLPHWESIPLPNYGNINNLSVERIQSLMRMVSILSILGKVFFADSGMNNDEAIRLLERILICSADDFDENRTNDSGSNDKLEFDSNSFAAIQGFLKNSPVELKLGLWDILLQYYKDNKEYVKLQLAFEENVSFFLSFLMSSEFDNMSTNRDETLVRLLGSYGSHLKTYLDSLEHLSWNLPYLGKSVTKISNTVQAFLKLFELFYLFSLHEEAAIISFTKTSVKEKSVKAYERFKDIFVSTITLVLVYFKDYMLNNVDFCRPNTLTTVSELMCCVHEQLGWRRLCDAGNGLFLKFLQDYFLKLDHSVGCEHLYQILRCRFHYKIPVGNFVPETHDTSKPCEIDGETVEKFSKFILPLCFKKNPLLTPPKGDLKLIIDKFYEAVGNKDYTSEISSRNESSIEDFLETTSLTPKLLRELFNGLVDIEEATIVDNVAKDGLFFLEGLLAFISYKYRKKTTQSRTVELESVIKLLKSDLFYGTKRVEGWYLLGQAYGYLVEDDLIWTADKLTVPERKLSTANLQRKSLLCYFMAINEITKLNNYEEKHRLKGVVDQIMMSFSKSMFNAIQTPMEMHAFKVQPSSRLVNKPEGVTHTTLLQSSPVKHSLCLKIIHQTFRLAIKSKPSEWMPYYYLAKVETKLNDSAFPALDTIQRACLLAKEHSNPADPIIEPHYKLIVLTYKYFKKNQLTIEDAVNILNADPVLVNREDEVEYPSITEKFYLFTIRLLRRLMAYDKKKWQHKPKYRISKIYFDDLKDYAKAKDEMISILSLKATSKALVQIWKPENERSGKHFHYTYQYALFYVNILFEKKDLKSLVQMLPKLRRSNSTMFNLPFVWETLCFSICKIIRGLLKIDDNLSENFIMPLSFQKFVSNSNSSLEKMKSEGLPKELLIHVYFLLIITDMKKLNNGFGPTSLIDDLMICVFVKIYMYFDTREASPNASVANPITESPSGRTKKLAKRDFFPLINEILKNFKKDVEDKVKDSPEYCNNFLQGVLEEQESLPESKLALIPRPISSSHNLLAGDENLTNPDEAHSPASDIELNSVSDLKRRRSLDSSLENRKSRKRPALTHTESSPPSTTTF